MIKKIKDSIRWLIYKGLYKPGHFYSTIPAVKEVFANAHNIFGEKEPMAVDLSKESQLLLLDKLGEFKTDFVWPRQQTGERRYFSDNSYFNPSDAFALHSLIRFLKPNKIIEIGSGFSSAMMMDTNELFCNNNIKITFVEPFPDRLQSLLKESDRQQNIYSFVPKFIQDVDVKIFTELRENDILFIDSSHVSKIGSDLNHILFEIIPKLKKGVYIHFHDIFYPLEYPKEWIKQGIYWNEIYLLRAFLMFNNSFEIVLFNSYWNSLGLEGLEEFKSGGSLWLRKIS
jgi:predicted O-methyltransferase YrrM